MIDGCVYELKDTDFPTIDPNCPYVLTEEEKQVIERLKNSFRQSTKLQEHVSFLFSKGSMYKIYNDNLLYHGCILMNEDGSFQKVKLDDKEYYGKAYLDKLEEIIREGYFHQNDPLKRQKAQDMMWYLWCGRYSPLFGKSKMATFERYFIKEKKVQEEKSNAYYSLLTSKELAYAIFDDFGMEKEVSHIINGHVPVKVKKGETPIKAEGKLIVIDGGFTKAYQKITGIAGYTLIYNSYGLQLASHQPFEGVEKAIDSERDIVSTVNIIEYVPQRKMVKDTDVGKNITSQIQALLTLVDYYRQGLIKEKEI
jgi:fructose-1,6-bisphosphatase-3